MGMQEERFNWAAGMETHAKRMYDETGNPYYIVAAIAASRIANWKTPAWALEKLLDSTLEAWLLSNKNSMNLSIDKALGISTKRGGTPAKVRALKASVEQSVFDLIKTIHACFDASIPQICEIVFYAIDFDFAKEMEEILYKPSNAISQSYLDEIGMKQQEWDAIKKSEIERSEIIMDSDSHTEAVKAKLRKFRWWEITNGDRLSYSLDQLIDRYHRDGTKRIVPHGKATEQTKLFFDGHFLLLIPEKCTQKININSDELGKYECTSSLAGFTMRPAFKAFSDRLGSAY